MTYELSAWPSLPPNWGAEVLGCLGRPAWFPLYRIRYDKQPGPPKGEAPRKKHRGSACVPKGRDEDNLPFPMAWVRHHDREICHGRASSRSAPLPPPHKLGRKPPAKHLIRLDLTLLFCSGRRGATRSTVGRAKGCAPFGNQCILRSEPPGDFDRMIWPAARRGNAGIRTRRRRTWKHISC